MELLFRDDKITRSYCWYLKAAWLEEFLEEKEEWNVIMVDQNKINGFTFAEEERDC